tara:strand:- start:1124 stop:1603 length:480 start_codon:yes stop_codon:yes gene_type:complete
MAYTTFDCETEKGQIYIESEIVVAERIAKAKNYHAFHFGTGSRIDRLYYDDDGKVRFLCEIRSRENTLNDLCNYGSVICNTAKLDDGAQLAKLLNVDFYLFVRTLHDDKIIYCKIADKKGAFLANMIDKKQTMQKSCNGGLEEKMVSYIDIGQWTKMKE